MTRFNPKKVTVTENETVPSLIRECAFTDIWAREMMASTLSARDRLDPTPCRNRKNLRLSTARRRFRKKIFALESVFEMMRFQRKKKIFLQQKGIQVGRVPKNN